MITNENVPDQNLGWHPEPLGTGADSFKRVLGSSGHAIEDTHDLRVGELVMPVLAC